MDGEPEPPEGGTLAGFRGSKRETSFGGILPTNPPRVAASRESAAIVETQSAALSRDAATPRFMGSKRETCARGILSPVAVPRPAPPIKVNQA